MEETIGTPAQDAEAFRRVWQRVQAGREASTGPLPAVSPAPPRWDAAAFLQDALTQTRLRDACCRAQPQLRPLSPLYRGQARRLAAALFLRWGIRPAPAQPAAPRPWPGLEERCRQLFLWERRAEAGCRSALALAQEPELRALLRELAGESLIQQQRLRLIVESLMEC